MTEDRLVYAPEAARLLAVSVKTLRRMARPRPLPLPTTGKRDRPRWSYVEIMAFIAELKQRREAS